jgi:porin
MIREFPSHGIGFVFFLSFVVLYSFMPQARCGPEATPSPAPSPSPGLLEGIHSSTEDRGITFSAEYTGEVLADLSGGLKTGATYEGLLRFGLQLDLKKIVGWEGATFCASALDPHGEGISREYSGDFNIASNIDAYNSIRLFELWIQQKLPGGALSIRVGQMSADQEFFLSTNSALFLNSGFGTMPTISFNNKLPIYPVGGLGARVEYKPNDQWFFRAAVFDADPGVQNTSDKNGTAFRLNLRAGVIVIAETGYSVNTNADSTGLAMSYKIGVWYDSSHEETHKIMGQHNSDSGFYAIADQMLYRRSATTSGPASLRAFFRISAAPQQSKNLVPFYVDGGFNLYGLFPSRDKDIFGFAVGYTRLSDHFVPENVAVHSGHETVLEASYKLQINDHLFLQPDLQYIVNPGGYRHLESALVTALRFDFTY